LEKANGKSHLSWCRVRHWRVQQKGAQWSISAKKPWSNVSWNQS